MLSKVSNYIREHRLLDPDALHLVALSGGADSVALLLALKQLGYRLEAIHCNFHLRGEESDRDETFCQTLCERENIPFHRIHFDTKEYASVHHVSIEMAARDLRYRYFEQLRQDIGASCVCVAHHCNDTVETLLMGLMRGAGIHGMTGIRPVNGHVVRPLLGVSRSEIESFLRENHQDYVTDSTNLSPTEALRNKVRLQLIPLFEQIQPGSTANISRSALYLSEAEKVYNMAFHDLNIIKQVSCSELLSMASPMSFLHEWLSPHGFNRSQISQILALASSESLSQNASPEFLSGTHSLLCSRGTLYLEQIGSAMKPHKIPEPGRYNLDEMGVFRFSVSPLIEISKDPTEATLDASAVRFPLTVRAVEPGDVFHPYGMRGKKLVSDFLTDCKLTLHEKRRQLVVTTGDGEIVWLVGRRTDNRFCVTSSTAAVLTISLLR